MTAVVVYESMFGNTHAIAEEIASGLRERTDTVVLPVAQARPEVVAAAELVVVGGPTHMHGMSRARSRHGAAQMAGKPDSELELEPGAEGAGLRDWFGSLGRVNVPAAAFDTRLEGVAAFTGQASHPIGRQLRRHGFPVVARESFRVTKDNELSPGERDRARRWGEQLAVTGLPAGQGDLGPPGAAHGPT